MVKSICGNERRESSDCLGGKALQEEGAKYKAPEFGMNVLCLRKGKVM